VGEGGSIESWNVKPGTAGERGGRAGWVLLMWTPKLVLSVGEGSWSRDDVEVGFVKLSELAVDVEPFETCGIFVVLAIERVVRQRRSARQMLKRSSRAAFVQRQWTARKSHGCSKERQRADKHAETVFPAVYSGESPWLTRIQRWAEAMQCSATRAFRYESTRSLQAAWKLSG
jgi:hypothetical protein